MEEQRFTHDLAATLQGFGTLPVPVIAAIDGPQDAVKEMVAAFDRSWTVQPAKTTEPGRTAFWSPIPSV